MDMSGSSATKKLCEVTLIFTAYFVYVLLDFLVTVKAAPHECVIRTGQP